MCVFVGQGVHFAEHDGSFSGIREVRGGPHIPVTFVIVDNRENVEEEEVSPQALHGLHPHSRVLNDLFVQAEEVPRVNFSIGIVDERVVQANLHRTWRVHSKWVILTHVVLVLVLTNWLILDVRRRSSCCFLGRAGSTSC